MVTGSPACAVSVPAGTSLRSAGSPRIPPAAITPRPPRAVPRRFPPPEPAASVRPARIRAAPAAVRSPSIIRCSWPPPAAGGPSRIRAGTAIDAATATIGSRPRNTHRQPNSRATSALIAGPASPGATQAVDRIAIMRARSGPGRVRPITAYATEGAAPAPRPCSTRPATSTPIEGARPARARPDPNNATPATNGTAGPRRSASRPAATMPITLPSMNPLNTQPYRRRPPRSRATTGMTVTTASASDATKVTVRTKPTVIARRCGAISPPPSAPSTAGSVMLLTLGGSPGAHIGRAPRQAWAGSPRTPPQDWRSGRRLVEPEADLQGDLEVAAPVVLDAASHPGHLEPVQVMQGLGRATDRPVDRVVNALGRGADDLGDRVDVVRHGKSLPLGGLPYRLP